MLNKHRLIAAGFSMFEATKLHRLVEPWTRGQGAILMFHHVRPWIERAYAPNRLLEITPDFLDAVLTRVRVVGFDIVSLDEALLRLGDCHARPFAALTFDDGYKDFALHALCDDRLRRSLGAAVVGRTGRGHRASALDRCPSWRSSLYRDDSNLRAEIGSF